MEKISKNGGCYFEGWYFKHTQNSKTAAFIPSVHYCEGGAYASLQVITDSFSHSMKFSVDEFSYDEKNFFIRIGKNIFSSSGIEVDIDAPVSVKGKISYGSFTAVKSCMGPFKNLECNHEIISLHHTLRGSLKVGEETVDFCSGDGYIEKDWGRSFPSAYFWSHSFDPSDSTSVFASAARVPLFGKEFLGNTALVVYNSKPYRFATFNLSSVKQMQADCLRLKKGRYALTIRPHRSEKFKLLAPDNGEMSREVCESASTLIDVTLSKGGVPIFEKTVVGSYESYNV